MFDRDISLRWRLPSGDLEGHGQVGGDLRRSKRAQSGAYAEELAIEGQHAQLGAAVAHVGRSEALAETGGPLRKLSRTHRTFIKQTSHSEAAEGEG